MPEDIHDLRKDQENLKEQLSKLESYIGEKEEKPQPEKKPAKPAETTPSTSTDTQKLLKQHIKESKEIMEKFDYLMDVLISSSKETEDKSLDKLVYNLAQTQSHAVEVLSNIQSMMEKVEEEAVSKQELQQFEAAQKKKYEKMNQKIEQILEKTEEPPYLKQLDLIRVGISNILSEIKKLEKEKGIESPDIKKEAQDVDKKFKELHKKTVSKQEETPPKKEFDDLNQRVEKLGKSLEGLSGKTGKKKRGGSQPVVKELLTPEEKEEKTS